MKKLVLWLFVSTLLTPFSLFAQLSNYVKLGVNYSTFRTEGGKSEPGLTFGFGKDFYPIRSFSGFWGVGVDYVRKKVSLENKTWPTNIDPNISDVIIGNINADIGYIEAIASVGFALQLREDAVMAKIVTGFLISLPIKNHTGGKIRDIIFLNPDEKGKFEFDYVRWDDKRTSISLGIQYGTHIIIKPFAVTLLYTKALTDTEGFTVQTISDKLNSFQITLAYAF